jgi:hypothetical protein
MHGRGSESPFDHVWNDTLDKFLVFALRCVTICNEELLQRRRFVLHVIKPVIPRNTLYFEAAPPHRLLKQEGATFVGGPEVTTELIRFYIAGPPPVIAAPAVAAAHPPAAAVLGGSSIAQ